MEYDVDLFKYEAETVRVEADSPELAIKKAVAGKDGWNADFVTEIISEEEVGSFFEVVGKCAACSIPVFDGQYVSDCEGEIVCNKCGGDIPKS